MLPPVRRREFILSWLDAYEFADVLDTRFVRSYATATGAPVAEQPYGAPKCPTLGRDLSAMYREGLLDREACGLSGMEEGFPSWVYVYTLAG